MRFEAPLTTELVDELFSFWTCTFGESANDPDYDPDLPQAVFLGQEYEYNHNTVYLERRSEKLAGTCGLTVSKKMPILGGLGEVATNTEFRRVGIATKLCQQAVDEFRELGGQALFLGTGNPNAARVYYRLGWRKLAGARVMANISSGDSPESFLIDYFRGLEPAIVRAATPEDRIPIIPLLVSPHDWQILDANAAMFSTRYSVQGSCMGLYRRYAAVARDNRGSWFSACTPGGHVVGLSTSRLEGSGRCRVDAFTHKDFESIWSELVQAAIEWGTSLGVSSFTATVSVADEEKRAMFESIGFLSSGSSEPFKLDDSQVESVRLEL